MPGTARNEERLRSGEKRKSTINWQLGLTVTWLCKGLIGETCSVF